MIGVIAACLTTLAFLPQVIKTVQTKDTSGISLGMYAMQVTGIFLWLCHGIRIGDLPLIMANAVSFVLSGIILVYKIRYK
ncbi:MtN3 and saliva related transmembrane protein [Streptococcus rupicaprae]|uniref:MtN3 and saliva related transmembrane protein n=1 Tax=Streptococcus rupicaprae TaxID=759619 RepID=A0ABV2FJ25_9STRE